MTNESSLWSFCIPAWSSRVRLGPPPTQPPTRRRVETSKDAAVPYPVGWTVHRPSGKEVTLAIGKSYADYTNASWYRLARNRKAVM
jgi:hypothetical protein